MRDAFTITKTRLQSGVAMQGRQQAPGMLPVPLVAFAKRFYQGGFFSRNNHAHDQHPDKQYQEGDEGIRCKKT
jgi:hypothetical protein